ncbi:MAG: DUF1800 domain-containing protein [Phycisphaeraceae bacterium]
MPVNTSLAPLKSSSFGYLQAQHLLARAGFGGTPAQIQALVAMGLEQAVDSLVNYDKVDASQLAAAQADPDLLRPATQEEKLAYAKAKQADDQEAFAQLRAGRVMRENQDRQQMRGLVHWWFSRMVDTPRPLEEKLTLLWHGHFASNHRTVRDSFLMYQQNALLREHAAGNFAQLVYGIIRDPAMLRFLDNNSNRKSKPNENLARELMELFTLGEGNYSEDDIKQGARALTGYSFEDNDFVFHRRQHDSQAKQIFGQSGDFAGEDFVRLILAKPACSEFVAFKLYKHFVADVTDPRRLPPAAAVVVRKLAEELRRGEYALRPVLTTLFRSQHFYDATITGNMIKSPAQLLAGSMRVLATPRRDLGVLTGAMQMMGQELFNPPSVKGWDGGETWINSSTLFVRQNLCVYLLTGKMSSRGKWKSDKSGYDATAMIDDAQHKSPQTLVDTLMSALLGAQRLPQHRDTLLDFVKERGVKDDTVLALLLLITAMPEYQLC